MFERGDRVMTPLGPGTVVSKRMVPPNYCEVQAYSVCLDDKLEESKTYPFKHYNSTVFPAHEVSRA